jgi:hypothetical protein
MPQTKAQQDTAQRDDNVGFMIGLVLFSVLIPALFGIAVYLSPS